MKKRFLAAGLAAAMVFSMAACGGSNDSTGNTATNDNAGSTTTESTANAADNGDAAASSGYAMDKSYPAETVKIGLEIYDVTDAQFLAVQDFYNTMSEAYNVEFMYSESIDSAESEMKFVENCAAAGCKAVIGMYNISEGEVVQKCIDLGMYYWGGADKAAIYDKFKDNDLYLGSYDNGQSDYEAGHAMAQTLIDQGCKKLVYVSGGDEFGVDMFINRRDGFYAAAEEAGDVEIVKKVAGWPGTDAFTAAQSEVCDMDFDGIGCSFTAAVWFQPLANVGKLDGSVKIATIGVVDDTYKDLADAGVVSCLVYDCEEVMFCSALPMILNAVAGHSEAVRNADGTAANFTVPRWIIKDGETYDKIYDKHVTNHEFYVTADDIANMLVDLNADATFDQLADFYGSKTVDACVQ